MVKETRKRLTKEDRTETYYWVTKLTHIPLYVKGAYPVLRRFTEQHDVEVVIAGPDDSATEPYVQAVYEAIQQGAAGIMVSGWGDEEIIPAVDAAVESGVPVVSVDGDVPGSKRLAHVGTDWFRMGVAMADKLVALMGERGKVLMMGLADLANIQAGFHGFQYRMAAYPDVEVLGPENDMGVGFGKAEAIVTEYRDKHPDLSGIAGFGINSGPGAAMALEKAGMAGKVKLVCTDTEEPHLEYLKAGVIDAIFAQKRETFTYLAFQMVYAYNHGSLTTGYQPGPANISGNIDTGHVIVTEENVETFEGELSIEEAFAQEQLSRRLDLLSSMIENSADLALATDANGYIMYANPASVRLCGFAEEQMLAFSWEEIFDLTDEQREQVARCMAPARSTSFETLARRKDGSTLPVQLSVSLMTTDATTSGMVLIATDITERKQAEEALAHERDLLQQEIAERERAQAESLRLQQEVIEAQQRAIQELSTPIIPVLERVIVMPLIGSIDTMRARDITRSLLAGIREHKAKVVILDITGVPIVDTGVANHLNKTIQAARLKGARTIVTGISDSVAETIVDLGIDWSGIETLRDLQTGLRAALA